METNTYLPQGANAILEEMKICRTRQERRTSKVTVACPKPFNLSNQNPYLINQQDKDCKTASRMETSH